MSIILPPFDQLGPKSFLIVFRERTLAESVSSPNRYSQSIAHFGCVAGASSGELRFIHMGLEILYGIGALVLLGGLAYGVHQWSHRNKANDPITEAATREQYKHPERYARKTHKVFEEMTTKE